MRGALKKFEGIEIVDLKVGEREFQVRYDESKCKPEEMLAAMAEGGEPAKLKE